MNLRGRKLDRLYSLHGRYYPSGKFTVIGLDTASYNEQNGNCRLIVLYANCGHERKIWDTKLHKEPKCKVCCPTKRKTKCAGKSTKGSEYHKLYQSYRTIQKHQMSGFDTFDAFLDFI